MIGIEAFTMTFMVRPSSMSRSKIAIVHDVDFNIHNDGGASRIAKYMYDCLLLDGHHVDVFTSTSDCINGSWRKIQDTHHPSNLIWAYLNPSHIARYICFLCLSNARIVFIHNIHSRLSIFVICISLLFGKRVFFVAHDSMLLTFSKAGVVPTVYMTKPAFRKFTYQILRSFSVFLLRFTIVLPVSEKLALFYKKTGVNNVRVLRNGIPDFRVRPSTSSDLSNPLFLLYGRMCANKGLYAFIEILNLLSLRLQRLQACVVGVSSDMEVSKLYNSLNAPNCSLRVYRQLPHDDIRQIVNDSTAIVIPSLYLDPYPTTCLEAMSAGKAVFVSRYSGASEAIIDNLSGFVIDPADPYQAALTIYGALSIPSNYMRVCENARSHWEIQHSIEHYRSSLADILSSL